MARKHDYQFTRSVTTTGDILYSISWPDHTPYNKKISELNAAVDDFINTYGAMAKFTIEINDIAYSNIKYATGARYDIVRHSDYLLLMRKSPL